MFQLLTPQLATIASVTNRTEKHGDEEVPAISIGLKVTTSNQILDLLYPGMRQTLYMRPEGQDELPGVEETTPLLRTPGIEHLMLKASFEGWTLVIEHGIDDESEIAMGSCKVDKFKAICHEGGTTDLFFRVGTSDVSPDDAGLLWSKQRQEVSITLRAPEKKPEPIDGSNGAFEVDHPKDATDIFADIED